MTLEFILKAAVNSMIQGHHLPHCFSAHVPGKGWVNRGHTVEEMPEFLRQLQRTATSEIENIGFSLEYAEPGYSDPEKGILLANWNCLPRELPDILEKYGYAIEWSDEWTTCGECGKAIRTSPDSYSWRKSFMIYNDCEIVCEECTKKNLDEYEESLLNDETKADTLDVDWQSRGFTKFNDEHYESGFHPEQNDDPKKIVKQLPKDVDFLFSIPSVGQFDMRFDCWIRRKRTDY